MRVYIDFVEYARYKFYGRYILYIINEKCIYIYIHIYVCVCVCMCANFNLLCLNSLFTDNLFTTDYVETFDYKYVPTPSIIILKN